MWIEENHEKFYQDILSLDPESNLVPQNIKQEL
jgi:hypothetical protein